MARTISDEELQLKRRARRRLIGAIVLVTAIIVVLPMVLDSEPKPVSRDIAVQIPSPDSGKFAGKLAQLPAPKDAKAAPKAPDSRTPERTSQPNGAAATAAHKPEAPPVKKPKAPARPAAKAAKPAAKTGQSAEGRYVVQVIALADAAKAKSIQEQIAGAGIKAYTEVVKTSKGDVTRVRAGPFATREAAEKAREQLKSLGMNGNITAK